jgi:hypothetical protein
MSKSARSQFWLALVSFSLVSFFALDEYSQATVPRTAVSSTPQTSPARTQALGATPSPKPPARYRRKLKPRSKLWYSNFKVKNTLETYLSAGAAQVSDSTLNPDNRRLSLTQKSAALDLREDFSLSYKDDNRLVLRPRILLNTGVAEYTSPTESKTISTGKLDLTDAFYESQLFQNFSVTLGLQVYQWGPAELLSPSNPIYHFNTSQRSFFYKEKGHVLARANLTLGNLSVVALSEVVSNNETYWIAEKQFSPQSLLKSEWRFENPSNYAGFIIGEQEQQHPFIGEYLVFYPFEGFSFYLDARHSQGITAYLPQLSNSGYYVLAEDDLLQNQTLTLATVGLRYEGPADLRLEYISNQAGYNKTDFQNAKRAVTELSPYLAANISRFYRSGLELPGANYLYLSARFPDFWSIRDVNLYLRYLMSLQDNSGSFQMNVDKVLTESLVGYVESDVAQGSRDDELTIFNRWQIVAGLKWSL